MHVSLREGMNEDDIERLFGDVYVALGYTKVAKDILGKRGSRSGIPDVRLLNSDESIQVIVELKKPSENLSEHEPQLFRYVRDLKARYGLLSNGADVWLYKRNGLALEPPVKTTSAALGEDALDLAPFAKETLEPTDFNQVRARLEEARREGLALTDIGSLPAEQFLGAFALVPESPFGELVESTQALLLELLGSSDFVGGAYEFWQKTYARELSSKDAPRAWTKFPLDTSKEGLQRFSFALETAYLLTARLILAKAIQDHDDERQIDVSHIADRFSSYLATQTEGRSGQLPPTAYLSATEKLFDGYATTLFTSIYAKDLFDWWRDFAKASGAAQNAFALAVSRTILSLLRFDFRKLEGDLLGELYQNYFDPETRKALGEFYTPPEVVEFILDEVGYSGDASTRLLDPATGSGTFLIAALRRYLRANAERDPVAVLDGITKEFRLVAFDVNPFAVLIAQINAAALLVPLYTRAIKQDPKLVLRRLPIVRTDSLRQEVIEGETQQKGQQFGFDFGSEEITAYVELPVRDPERQGQPLRVGITFPSLEAAKNQGKIRNERLWLLALQSVFATVEKVSQAYDETQGKALPDLKDLLRAELALFEPDPAALTSYLEPYARGVWEKLRLLKEGYGDGRFLKTLEDLTLGLVLKHYLQYDFVVGNPPYVRVQNLPEIQKKYWADKYIWARGSFDIFVPFIERVLYGDRPWLRKNGKLGFIVPNRFLNATYAAGLRGSLPKVAKVLSITDFKAVTFAPPEETLASRLFKEAMVYPAILIAERDTPKEPYTFKTARFYPKSAPLQPAEAIGALGRSYAGSAYTTLEAGSRAYADVFEQASESLTAGGWHLMPEPERSVFEKLEAIGNQIDETLPEKVTDQTRKLKNYTATESGGFQGIATGFDGVFVLKQLAEDTEKGLLHVQPRGGGEPFWVEKEPLRPFLFGKDVERWHVGWEGWWVIFPYFRHSGRFWFMPSTDYWRKELEVKRGKKMASVELFKHWPDDSPMIDKAYPKLWAYLKANEKDFRGRENGRFKKGKPEVWRWYDLARPQSLEAAEGKKVVAQLLAKNTQFALEDKGGVHFQAGGKGGGAYGISLKPGVNDSFILGLLNSKALDFQIKHLSSVYGSGYYSYADAYLKDLPIPDVTEDQQTAITELAQTLTETTARLRKLKAAVAAFPDSVTAARRTVGTVPDLEALERLGLLQGVPREVRADKMTSEHDLTGQVVLRVGNGRMTFTPTLAELVEAVLATRGKLSYEALAALNVPEREPEQHAYVATLRQWQAERIELSGEITRLEDELNGKVYEVYGLEDERDVIEGFLERF